MEQRLSCPKFVFPHASTFWSGPPCHKNPTTRMLGAEIEVGSCTTLAVAQKLDRNVTKWGAEVHADCAFEVCTAPASGTQWVKQVEEFCALFAEGQIGVNNGCGCHVHIDARDVSPKAIHRFLQLVCHIEPVLYSMVPPERRNSVYCRKASPTFRTWLACTAAPTYERWLLNHISGYAEVYKQQRFLARVRAARSKYNGQVPRYLSFNLKPYFGYGTVECRLLEGCVNPVRIINWGVTLAAIMDTANQTEQAALDVLLRLSPLQVLLKMSPSLSHKRWITKTIRTLNPVEAPIESTAPRERISA